MSGSKLFTRSILALALTISLANTYAAAPLPATDIEKIEKITGLKGKLSKEENVFKVSKPRDDVTVKVDRWTMPPFMGLTSWAAFTSAHEPKITMMMSDTVLFEDEVNPAMSVALDAGLEVTALHNHFFFDQPKVYFMHIGGLGDAAELATGVKKVYDKVAQIRAAQPTPATQFPNSISQENSITAAPLEAIFNTKGESNRGMFKVTIGRPATMHTVKVGKEMGVNTWAAFAGSDNQAVVDGDFAVREDELQATLRTLRAGGINIVAIHQHMTHEQPRYLFLHYWGKGKAQDLAKTVKKALDLQTNPTTNEAHGKQ
ncbi:hypothetical protein AAY72_02095 [Alishewanella sp. WH16-1]|nr:hypothetical protein AAY72_02095 [Alishewanella sp. WH16-1]